VSILEGKGDGMPAFNGRLNADQARGLVAHVRAFGPARRAEPPAKEDAATDDFKTQFQQLQKEFEDLRAQAKELDAERQSKAGAQAARRRTVAAGVGKAVRPAHALFRQHCQRCHGPDGKGGRDGGDEMPDFTLPPWQQKHSDEQIALTILDGKGDGMPAFRRRLNEAEAKGLVGHIRALGTTPTALPSASDILWSPGPRRRDGGGAL
jgi:mono/diheme cytochrome c family protein